MAHARADTVSYARARVPQVSASFLDVQPYDKGHRPGVTSGKVLVALHTRRATEALSGHIHPACVIAR